MRKKTYADGPGLSAAWFHESQDIQIGDLLVCYTVKKSQSRRLR
jgi:hypothetical protein